MLEVGRRKTAEDIKDYLSVVIIFAYKIAAKKYYKLHLKLTKAYLQLFGYIY